MTPQIAFHFGEEEEVAGSQIHCCHDGAIGIMLQIRSFTLNVLSQMPQNGAVEPDIDSLTLGDEFILAQPHRMSKKTISMLLLALVPLHTFCGLEDSGLYHW